MGSMGGRPISPAKPAAQPKPDSIFEKHKDLVNLDSLLVYRLVWLAQQCELQSAQMISLGCVQDL